jgi:hypothetical protein
MPGLAPQEAAASPPPLAAAKKPPAAAREDGVFTVRFDSKATGLTPLSIRHLDQALDAVDAGRKVSIAIEGCDDREAAPEGVDCTALRRRLKRILVERGVDRPDELVAKPR